MNRRMLMSREWYWRRMAVARNGSITSSDTSGLSSRIMAAALCADEERISNDSARIAPCVDGAGPTG